MAVVNSDTFLRRVLWLDAATCIGCGTLLAAGGGLLDGLLGLPAPLLRLAGASLFPVAAFIAWLALRVRLSPVLVWVVIVGNVIWAADSILLLFTPWVAPTLLGTAFVLAQALMVLGLARAEQLGLRGAAA